MQNLTPLPILPGLNDAPEILEDGPNGALVTERINQLVQKSFRPFNTIEDSNETYARYLDTINGSDDNDGLTANTAYKTWERAIQDFRVGMITDNWNTYLYIRGELQAPLDLRGVYGFSSSGFLNGTLQLTKFPSDTEKWSFKGVEGGDQYLSKLAFITDGTNLLIAIYEAIITIPDQLEFHRINTDIADCIVKTTPTSYMFFLLFGDGLHSQGGVIYDFAAKSGRIGFSGKNCLTLNYNRLSIINDSFGDNPFPFDFLHFQDGCKAVWNGNLLFPGRQNQGTPVGIMSVQRGAELLLSPNAQNWQLNLSVDASFEWIDFDKNNDSLVLFFPELTNGRYKIWFPNKKCRLLEWRLSANAGDGTFRMDIGIGFSWGDPLTQTFTSNYEEIVREMNLDFPANAWRMFLNVTNSTVPLKNVHLQLNYRNY